MLSALGDITFGQLLLGIALGVVLSLIVFSHASKHGSRHATAWGVAVFLVPLSLIVYFANYYLSRRR